MEVRPLGTTQVHDREAGAITFQGAASGTMTGLPLSLGWRRPLSRADPGSVRGMPAGPHLARSSPAAELHGRRALAVAVKIKLKRMGKIRAPFYRIIVADARTKRDGRAIEEIGKYHPKVDPSLIEVNSDRAQYWLSVGAQPTDPVRRLLEITGDWQKFKGLPGTEGTLKTAAPKPDKKDAFAAAVAETVKEIKVKGKAAEPKAAGAKTAEGKGADGKAAEPKADRSTDKGRGRRQSGSGDKASAGKAAEDTAAKDGAPKDG